MTATPQIDEQLLDEAEAWHRALDRSDADWDAYTLWLEADPRHRLAFDQVELAHRIVDERIGNLAKEPLVEPPVMAAAPSSRRRWISGGVAAALALAIGTTAFWPQAPSDVAFATARGETRRLALGDGVSVDLAPSTRLILHRRDATDLELVQGDALFTVAHDPRRRLSIKAGEFSVSDIGTTFGVQLSPEAVKIGVAEGRLTVSGGEGSATTVTAGHQLLALRRKGTTRVAAFDRQDVGSWRHGRLVYVDTPLSVVAADISRYSGKTVIVDPAIDDQAFSGVLAIGDGSRLLANVADILDLSYEETGDGARLGPAARR